MARPLISMLILSLLAWTGGAIGTPGVQAQSNSYGGPRPIRPVLTPRVPRPTTPQPTQPQPTQPTPQAQPRSAGAMTAPATPRGTVTPPRTRLELAEAPEPRPSLFGLVEGQDYTPDIVLVRLEGDVPDAELAALFQSVGVTLLASHASGLLGVRVLRLRLDDGTSLPDALEQLPQDLRIRLAQPEFIFRALQGSSAPGNAAQYALQVLQVEEAHRLATGRDVPVAIIDTGIDIEHPEFATAQVDTFDATDEIGYTADNHGSQIAGVIGSRGTLMGIAPDASILSAQAFWRSEAEDDPTSTTMAVLKSLDWAADNGALVFNLSFAGAPDPVLSEALSKLQARGAILIAAAGNGGPGGRPAFPGAHSATLAVTATDLSDALYADATHGIYVDIAAPGVDILAPQTGGRYGVASGTSVAAAFVSGAAALMLQNNPTLSSADLKALFQSTAVDLGEVGRDEAFGAGRLNLIAVLSQAAE